MKLWELVDCNKKLITLACIYFVNNKKCGDFCILDFIYDFFKCPFLDAVIPKITALGNSGAIWIITAIVFLCFKKLRKTGIGIAIALILGVIIGNFFLKNIVARIRPFDLVEGINLLINAPKDFSFPSGHTLSSISSATVIFMNNKKIGIYFLILAVLIAFSRLYLYVHFPSDVIGGAVLGIIIGIFSVYLTNKIKKF